MAFNAKPDKVPEFCRLDIVDPISEENNSIEPSEGKKDYGWDYLEKPPRNYFNWLHRYTYRWINYFNQFFSSTHDIQGGVPVGTIVFWNPGYMTNGNNGGYTPVSITLPDWWKELDGSLLNDSDSPIYNGSGRYLENLTDSRFLMGGTPGTIGGSNDLLAHTHAFTQPSAHTITQPVFTVPSHTHQWYNQNALTNPSETYNSGGNPIDIAGITEDPAGIMVATASAFKLSLDCYTELASLTLTRTVNVALTNNHSGGAVGAVAESRTDANLPKYLAGKYIKRTK